MSLGEANPQASIVQGSSPHLARSLPIQEARGSDGSPEGVGEPVDRHSHHIFERNTSESLPVSRDNADGGEDINEWLAIVDREVGVLLSRFERQVSLMHENIHSVYPVMIRAWGYNSLWSQTQMMIFNGDFRNHWYVSTMGILVEMTDIRKILASVSFNQALIDEHMNTDFS